MKNLSDYLGRTLQFTQPSIWKRAFELRYGSEILGTLTYLKTLSTKAEAKIFDKNWELYEPKWWKNLIEIKEAGKEVPIASYKPALLKSKGKILLPYGESLVLSANLFSTTLEILDHYNSRIVLLKRQLTLRTNYEIQIERRSEVLDRNPWVLLLIIYVEINKNRRRSGS